MSSKTEYQVIARKWRPQRFADVVGQEHLTQTLINAITQERTAHAYLFVGPRGIGKTSTARIFAKALNCTNPQNGEPCCECESCVAVAAESSMDVIEIDAASKNSVDSIRDLREEVQHFPANSKYKIYIIDEVHMLSNQAWNALLKTIEEPPSHVKFIFATTEAHKVLPTIVSRCQRFDLRRIPTTLIYKRLQEIAEAEGVTVSEHAIQTISRAADGGLRDAQSLLDQMISFFSADGKTVIEEEQVLSLFGLTSFSEMEDLVKAVLENNPAKVISVIHLLSLHGKNLETVFSELLSFLRGVQLSKLISNPDEILEDGDEAIATYKALGENLDSAVIQRLLEVLSPVGYTLHNALNKQIFIETIILKAMRFAHAVQIEDLLIRLNQIRKAGDLKIIDELPAVIESKLTYISNSPTDIAPPKAETPSDVPVTEPAKIEEVKSEIETPLDSPVTEPTETEEVKSDIETPSDVPVVEPEKSEEVKSEIETPSGVPNEDESSVMEATLDDYIADTKEKIAEERSPMVVSSEEVNSDIMERVEEEITIENEEFLDSLTPPTRGTLSERFSAEKLYSLFIDGVNTRDTMVTPFIKECISVDIKDNTFTIHFDEEYDHFERVKKELPRLRHILCEITEESEAKLEIELQKGVQSYHQEAETKRDETQAWENAQANEYVQDVLDLFGGKIVDVHGAKKEN